MNGSTRNQIDLNKGKEERDKQLILFIPELKKMNTLRSYLTGKIKQKVTTYKEIYLHSTIINNKHIIHNNLFH